MLLCGIDFETDAVADIFYDTIIDMNGLGASRKSIDLTSNVQSGAWAINILSCIKMLKPFTLTLVNTGNIDWVSKIGQAAKVLKIKFPAEAGFTAGVILQFSAGVTDVTFSGSIEGRSQFVVQITPSGAPTLTAAVPVT